MHGFTSLASGCAPPLSMAIASTSAPPSHTTAAVTTPPIVPATPDVAPTAPTFYGDNEGIRRGNAAVTEIGARWRQLPQAEKDVSDAAYLESNARLSFGLCMYMYTGLRPSFFVLLRAGHLRDM